MADWRIESASRMGAAFVFFIPHAVTSWLRFLSVWFGAQGISVFLRAPPAAKQKPGDLMYSRWHRTISEGLGFS